MKDYQFPKSATDPRVVILSASAMFMLVLGILIFAPDTDVFIIALSVITTTAIVSIFGEILIAKSHKATRVLAKNRETDYEVIRNKTHLTMLGISGFLLALMIAYLIIPEYRKLDYDYFHMSFLMGTAIFIPMVGFMYLPYVMNWLNTDRNIYANFGLLLSGQFKKVDKDLLSFLFQSVLLRGFFIPFMVIILMVATETIFGEGSYPLKLLHEDFEWSFEKASQIVFMAYYFLILLDVTTGTLGYILVTKSLNSDVRSLDPKFLGWFSCLICYPPFWGLVNKTFLLVLVSSMQWEVIFEGQETTLFFWSLLILLCGGMEAISGATFGIRFSNIAYRGLITSGPYRFSKHPQYISKMFHRIFVILPFIGYVSWIDWFSGMLGFSVLCLMYFLRARTEENHLTAFPDYVDYANAMNERGIFRWVGKIFPVFAYNEERSKKYHIFMR